MAPRKRKATDPPSKKTAKKAKQDSESEDELALSAPVTNSAKAPKIVLNIPKGNSKKRKTSSSSEHEDELAGSIAPVVTKKAKIALNFAKKNGKKSAKKAGKVSTSKDGVGMGSDPDPVTLRRSSRLAEKENDAKKAADAAEKKAEEPRKPSKPRRFVLSSEKRKLRSAGNNAEHADELAGPSPPELPENLKRMASDVGRAIEKNIQDETAKRIRQPSQKAKEAAKKANETAKRKAENEAKNGTQESNKPKKQESRTKAEIKAENAAVRATKEAEEAAKSAESAEDQANPEHQQDPEDQQDPDVQSDPEPQQDPESQPGDEQQSDANESEDQQEPQRIFNFGLGTITIEEAARLAEKAFADLIPVAQKHRQREARKKRKEEAIARAAEQELLDAGLRRFHAGERRHRRAAQTIEPLLNSRFLDIRSLAYGMLSQMPTITNDAQAREFGQVALDGYVQLVEDDPDDERWPELVEDLMQWFDAMNEYEQANEAARKKINEERDKKEEAKTAAAVAAETAAAAEAEVSTDDEETDTQGPPLPDDGPKIKFQYLSDVHFDLDPTKAEYNSFVLPKRAEYLILAGDIGSLSQDFENYSAFLIRQCRVFKRVFLVLGECEFKPLKAKKNHAEGVETARRLPDMLEMNGRLTLLEKNRYDLTEDDGTTVSILGCTLWSQFQQKYLKEKQFEFFENTTRTHTARFADHLSWLRASVKAIRDEFGKARKILVVTHHAPTIKNSDKPDREARMESGQYGSDILGGKALKVKALGRGDVWVYGHTNYTTEFYAAGVRVLANQRGPGNPDPVVNPGIHEFDVERTFEM